MRLNLSIQSVFLFFFSTLFIVACGKQNRKHNHGLPTSLMPKQLQDIYQKQNGDVVIKDKAKDKDKDKTRTRRGSKVPVKTPGKETPKTPKPDSTDNDSNNDSKTKTPEPSQPDNTPSTPTPAKEPAKPQTPTTPAKEGDDQTTPAVPAKPQPSTPTKPSEPQPEKTYDQELPDLDLTLRNVKATSLGKGVSGFLVSAQIFSINPVYKNEREFSVFIEDKTPGEFTTTLEDEDHPVQIIGLADEYDNENSTTEDYSLIVQTKCSAECKRLLFMITEARPTEDGKQQALRQVGLVFDRTSNTNEGVLVHKDMKRVINDEEAPEEGYSIKQMQEYLDRCDDMENCQLFPANETPDPVTNAPSTPTPAKESAKPQTPTTGFVLTEPKDKKDISVLDLQCSNNRYMSDNNGQSIEIIFSIQWNFVSKKGTVISHDDLLSFDQLSINERRMDGDMLIYKGETDKNFTGSEKSFSLALDTSSPVQENEKSTGQYAGMVQITGADMSETPHKIACTPLKH